MWEERGTHGFFVNLKNRRGGVMILGIQISIKNERSMAGIQSISSCNRYVCIK